MIEKEFQDEAVQEIAIVGGGTAGWLAALMLSKRLNAGPRGPSVKITLIESPNIPIIGVGEGCLPGVMKEFQNLGLSESEFMRRCNATFKFGVRFVDWNLNDQGQPYSFTHPVSSGVGQLEGQNPLYHYLAYGPHHHRETNDVADSLDAVIEAIRLNRAPRASIQNPYKGYYAYHFDAVRLAEYLREEATKRGVTHIVDDVDDVTIEDGEIISSLKLRRTGPLSVQLVIDCTGFKGAIISRFLKEPFQGYGKHLLCDRAIPIQVPYRAGEEIESCTTAQALSAGWAWRIPLFNRIGTGYVYSSEFRTDEEAVKELCDHLGLDPASIEPRIIHMRIGRLRRTWVGNCVAVGLSGAFVEPLEATAIMSVIVTVFMLNKYFPTRSMPEALRRHFNDLIGNFYDGVRDFISMHYFLANRKEPFWLAARNPTMLSESLREHLELWRHTLPDDRELGNPRIFGEKSYGICLAAKGFYRNQRMWKDSRTLASDWQRYSDLLDRERVKVRRLPSARQFLTSLRDEPSASSARDMANAI